MQTVQRAPQFVALPIKSSRVTTRTARLVPRASENGVPKTTETIETKPAAAKAESFGQLMAFSGVAPEVINSRLAQLGFASALFVELTTDKPVTSQLAEDGALVFCIVVAISCASLIPLLLGRKIEGWGPFTPNAEMVNGRAAMIGFASLLIAEWVRNGQALF